MLLLLRSQKNCLRISYMHEILKLSKLPSQYGRKTMNAKKYVAETCQGFYIPAIVKVCIYVYVSYMCVHS